MKIAAVSDLEYTLAKREKIEGIASKVIGSGADALIIAGDVTPYGDKAFHECLSLFEGFTGTKMLVAGNHDLWTASGDTAVRYEQELKRMAESHGFHYLDDSPLVIDGMGFVGNIGWYDYSFAEGLKVGSDPVIIDKSPTPGEKWTERDFVLRYDDFRRKMLGIRENGQVRIFFYDDRHGIRFYGADGKVLSDEEILDMQLRRLNAHLTTAETMADQIVVALHHIPIREMNLKDPVYGAEVTGADAYFAAFGGSPRIGELLARHPKITHVLNGHYMAGRKEFERAGVKYLNVAMRDESPRIIMVGA